MSAPAKPTIPVFLVRVPNGHGGHRSYDAFHSSAEAHRVANNLIVHGVAAVVEERAAPVPADRKPTKGRP